jgi:hypothetical protein
MIPATLGIAMSAICFNVRKSPRIFPIFLIDIILLNATSILNKMIVLNPRYKGKSTAITQGILRKLIPNNKNDPRNKLRRSTCCSEKEAIMCGVIYNPHNAIAEPILNNNPTKDSEK